MEELVGSKVVPQPAECIVINVMSTPHFICNYVVVNSIVHLLFILSNCTEHTSP